jgi:hypothetical protein
MIEAMTASAVAGPRPATTARLSSWKHRAWALGLVVLGTAAGAYIYAVDPNQPGGYPLCPTRALFGVDCPGCGSLRAIHALLHGDVARALDHNILLVLALPAIVAYLAYTAYGAFVRPVRPLRVPVAFGIGAVAVAVTYAVLRNLTWGPLAYLASGAS